MKLKKAVIPAAGLGTRFLPATKTVPKELLPIVDTPTLFHVVQDAVSAGVEDIVIVAGRNKTAIEDFFDTSYELEDLLEKTGKQDLLETIRKIQNMANIISIRQKEAKGLGHAVYSAYPVVGDEPFAVLLGDEIMMPAKENGESVVTQLRKIYDDTGLSTVAAMKVGKAEVEKYGIIAISEEKNGVMTVSSVVEKPDQENAPSQWALPGRYIFNSEIFDTLKNLPPGKNGEVQLTDAMTQVAQNQGMLATAFVARRYDAGDKFGYLQANIEEGLRHPQVGDKLKSYIKNLASQL